MNAEDYPSSEESSDEEYVPSDGEKVSEEEHSGEEEDFVPDSTEDINKQGKGKRKELKKKETSRKRAGGIKLEGEEDKPAEVEDDYSKKLAEQVQQEQVQRKEDEQKKKADSLWADFMKDVGGPKPKPKPASGGLGSLTSLSKSTTSSSKSSVSNISKPAATKPEPSKKVTVTKVFDFAGETVKVSKEVDANSKEAKAAQNQDQAPAEKKPTVGPSIPGLKRPGGGLGSVLGKIGKAPKMSVLDKSKLDWDGFKSAEGIEEELQIHNRGKQGFIERKQFLERTDLRQFELEKNMRLKNKHL